MTKDGVFNFVAGIFCFLAIIFLPVAFSWFLSCLIAGDWLTINVFEWTGLARGLLVLWLLVSTMACLSILMDGV